MAERTGDAPIHVGRYSPPPAGARGRLGCGAPGGVFGPIFFIGAMAGGSFRGLSSFLFPGLTGPRGSYALVGLGAFLLFAKLLASQLEFRAVASHDRFDADREWTLEFIASMSKTHCE